MALHMMTRRNSSPRAFRSVLFRVSSSTNTTRQEALAHYPLTPVHLSTRRYYELRSECTEYIHSPVRQVIAVLLHTQKEKEKKDNDK